MYYVVTDTVKQGANIMLLFLMVIAVYSHYMVNDKFERIAPALVSILKTVNEYLMGIRTIWGKKSTF